MATQRKRVTKKQVAKANYTDNLKWGDCYVEKGQAKYYFPLHQAQRDIYESPARFKLFLAGKQSGKSSFGAMWLCSKALAGKPGDMFLVISPTEQISSVSVTPQIVKHLKIFGLYDPDRGLGSANQNRGEYTLSNGTMLYVRTVGGDGRAENSFEGSTCSAILMDEAGMLPFNIYVKAEARVSTTQGEILLTTTPYSLDWLKTWFRPLTKSMPEYYYMRVSSSRDNPAFTQEEYERLKKVTPEHIFKRDYEADLDQTISEALYFPTYTDWLDDDLVPQIEPGMRLVGGIDFGNNTAAVIGATRKDLGVYYVLWEYYYPNTGGRAIPLGDHLRHIPKCGPQSSIITWYADSASPASIAEMQRMGYNVKGVKKLAGSVEDNLTRIYAMGAGGRLKIAKKPCPNLILELSKFKRAPAEEPGLYLDSPMQNQRNHAIDAMRYAIMGSQKIGIK